MTREVVSINIDKYGDIHGLRFIVIYSKPKDINKSIKKRRGINRREVPHLIKELK